MGEGHKDELLARAWEAAIAGDAGDAQWALVEAHVCRTARAKACLWQMRNPQDVEEFEREVLLRVLIAMQRGNLAMPCQQKRAA
jgi:hypothetical protein